MAVSFHGKEKSNEQGLKVSVIFFTLSSSISHCPSGKDVSVSGTVQPRGIRSVPGHLDIILTQVREHIKIIISFSYFSYSATSGNYMGAVLPNGNIDEVFSGLLLR